MKEYTRLLHMIRDMNVRTIRFLMKIPDAFFYLTFRLFIDCSADDNEIYIDSYRV